jgi:hypothetical protein
LTQESERGSAIILATIVEDGLQQMLQEKLVPSSEKNDELFSGAYAPLGSFSAKIDFAYRIGLIGLEMKSSLHFLRKIRNKFAHQSSVISFESNSIHNWIKELFRLNRNILDVTWKVVENSNHPEIREIIGKFESKRGVDYLVKVLGWKSTFEFLGSIIAAQIHALQTNIEPILHPKELKS